MEEGRQNEESPDENAGDTAILVSDQAATDSKKLSAIGDEMRVIAVVLDKLLFILLTVSYVLMILTLMPRY